ncbi:hypothetical protein [Thiolapillus sp.]
MADGVLKKGVDSGALTMEIQADPFTGLSATDLEGRPISSVAR